MAEKMTKKELLESKLLRAPGLSSEQVLSAKYADSVDVERLNEGAEGAKTGRAYVLVDPALKELVTEGGTDTLEREIPPDELTPMLIVYSAHRHWKNRQL